MAFDFPVCPVCRRNGRVAVKGDLEAVEGPVCSTCQGTGNLPRSLREALLRAAEADLRAARQYGAVGIAQTHHGLLNLSYERDSRVYELRRFDGSGGGVGSWPETDGFTSAPSQLCPGGGGVRRSAAVLMAVL
jgi:hypothetical protein